jgi:hypothetical protein
MSSEEAAAGEPGEHLAGSSKPQDGTDASAAVSANASSRGAPDGGGGAAAAAALPPGAAAKPAAADEQEQEQEDEAAGAPFPPAPQPCDVCGEQPHKYRCPGCGVRSCGLPCVQRHKAASGCSGKRDRLAFVPLSEFEDRTLLSGEWFGGGAVWSPGCDHTGGAPTIHMAAAAYRTHTQPHTQPHTQQ